MRYKTSFSAAFIGAGTLLVTGSQALAQGAQYPDSGNVAGGDSVFTMPIDAPIAGQPVFSQPQMAQPMPQPQMADPDPMPVRDQSAPPAVAQYDAVGYVTVIGAEYTGGPTASGEPFNPNGYSAGHNQLPVNSYVEVTHLTSGRTVLLRINDRVPEGNRGLVSISPAAAAILQIDGSSPVPIRVRRVNPPNDEKVALAQGQKAADRMNTPEPLLAALRKKLGTNPTQSAAAEPTPQPRQVPVAQPVKVAAQPAPKWRRPGANYEPAPAPVARPQQRGPTQTPPVQQQSAAFEPGSEYIIEDGSAPRPAAPSRWQSTGSGRYFVQLAAFNDRSRAYNLAHRMGAAVATNGALYRVRTGPYGSESAARASLGALAAKGYRGARVTR